MRPSILAGLAFSFAAAVALAQTQPDPRTTEERRRDDVAARAEIEKLTAQLAQRPDDAALYVARANASMRLVKQGMFYDEVGDAKAALADLDQAVRLASEDGAIRMARARVLLRGIETAADMLKAEERALDVARDDLDAVVRIGPPSVEAYSLRALVYRTRAMRSLGPGNVDAFDAALNAAAADVLAAAEIDAIEMRRRFPASLGASLRSRMAVLRKEGKSASAVTMARALARLAPGDLAALQFAVETVANGGDRAGARTLLDVAQRDVDAVPMEADARSAPRMIRGQLFAALGEADAARRAFDEVTELVPAAPLPYVHRASLLARAGKVDDALAEVERGLTASGATPSVELLIVRGQLRFQSKDTAAALADFEQATSVAPRDPRAWQSRAATLDSVGRRREAAQVLRTWRDSHGGGIELGLMIGMMLACDGDTEAARAEYDHAIPLLNAAALKNHLQQLDVAIKRQPDDAGLKAIRERLTQAIAEKA